MNTNNDSNINSNSSSHTQSKSKLKSKNKKRSLLNMRSIINSFTTERERNNSLKKREELLNNTSFNFSTDNTDPSKKIYLKRYNKNDNPSNNNNNNLYKTSNTESKINNINTLASIEDTYNELTKNKGFMKKSRELLKNKISKSKLLLHHKSSTNLNKSKRRDSNSKDNNNNNNNNSSKLFMNNKEFFSFGNPNENEKNYIKENNETYSSRHSTNSKNSQIYRHAQSLYDPEQDQVKSVRKLSDLENFKKTYSLVNKNYIDVEDNISETGNMNHPSLLENDYFKAYSSSSSRAGDFYKEQGKNGVNYNNK